MPGWHGRTRSPGGRHRGLAQGQMPGQRTGSGLPRGSGRSAQSSSPARGQGVGMLTAVRQLLGCTLPSAIGRHRQRCRVVAGIPPGARYVRHEVPVRWPRRLGVWGAWGQERCERCRVSWLSASLTACPTACGVGFT